ncbi:hypothetical protein CEXT_652061 [Caerostris extrusa]|uniref:Uncharacterized protein n=1 Tax=Caerostris extrusa TaxID=172846 RepID=A0AAV4RMJ0_CAEEX|nr:hypothetical protein CEXT_652061 [Caerostris extrusa]
MKHFASDRLLHTLFPPKYKFRTFQHWYSNRVYVAIESDFFGREAIEIQKFWIGNKEEWEDKIRDYCYSGNNGNMSRSEILNFTALVFGTIVACLISNIIEEEYKVK